MTLTVLNVLRSGYSSNGARSLTSILVSFVLAMKCGARFASRHQNAFVNKSSVNVRVELLWVTVYFTLYLAVIAVRVTGSRMFIICYVTLPPRRSSVVVPNKRRS